MKNKFKLFGIIAMFAIIGISISGCSSSKRFEGTWRGEYPYYKSYGSNKVPCTLVVGEKTFEISYNETIERRVRGKGTYQISSNVASFYDEDGDLRFTATVDGPIMTVINSDGETTLTKQ
jgi:hypothetical protein